MNVTAARPRLRSLAALLVGLAVTLPARAQAPTESAEGLFVRARGLMKTGDCAGALPLLEQSHALEPTLGARFNMAVCESRLGKLTQAREHLLSVVETSAADDVRRAHAERALRDLLPRIPMLVLELDAARHELELVRLDGETLSEMKPNEPFPINPGSHELEVVLAREAPQSRRFTVAERQMYTWSLGGLAATTATPVRSDPLGEEPPAREETSLWTTRRTAAVVAGGVSLASFGVAVGFVLNARSIYSSSTAPPEPPCDDDGVCTPEGIVLRDRARERGRIATVATTVGVAAAVAAATLWFTGSPAPAGSSTSLRVGVRGNALGREHAGAIVVEGKY